jgi:hypothetical protein
MREQTTPTSRQDLIREALQWESRIAGAPNDQSDLYNRDYLLGVKHGFARAFEHLGIGPIEIQAVAARMKREANADARPGVDA